MGRSLRVVGLLLLIFGLLGGQAFSAVHKHRSAGHRSHRQASARRHSSSHALKTARKSEGAAFLHGRSVAAEDEVIRLKGSKRRALAGASRRHPTRLTRVATTDEGENDEYVAYRVKRGDTLENLAEKFNIDKDEISDLNKESKRRLAPGAVVFIPKTQEDPEEAPVVLDDQPLKPWKNEEERGILVKVAKSFAGAPYRYGGESVRGLDCSAFVRKMYGIFEVDLPRCAREQYYAGQRVDRENLTTGDLVFFKTKRCASYPTHVGIYIGDGKFIHASSLPNRGVKIDHLSDSYFTRTYMGAVRVKAPPVKEPD
ncbi:MAG TPA: peptidoglycan endopeptidase [Syntrophorhabdales bacterium]|nr:peptidoglycan endopeptidase [Syntrophorhabdales bacterium]